MKRIGLSLLLIGLALLTASAQSSSKPLRVGLGLSAYTYRGDLSNESDLFLRAHPGMHLSLQFDGPRRLQLQLGSGFGRIIEQADRQAVAGIPSSNGLPAVTPNQFVETSLFFVDLRARFRFIRRGPVQPYIGAGVGLLFFTPRDENGNFLSDNIFSRPAGEVYDALAPSFPLMLGCDIRLHNYLGLGLLYTFRPIQSDFLDNIGSLGAQTGDDQLHEVTLSLHVYLQTSSAPKPRPEPVIEPEPPASQPDSSIVAEIVPAKPAFDWRNELAYMDEWLDRTALGVEPLAYLADSLAANPRLSTATLPATMTTAEVASYFDLTEKELTAANGYLPDLLPAGSLLYLPLADPASTETR